VEVISKRFSRFQNTLLKALAPDTIESLSLKPVEFMTGQKIEEPGKQIRYLYFLEEGMASMTTTFSDGAEVEVCMFGYESLIGASALMGTATSLNHVYTQIAGSGYRCTLEAAQKEFDRFGLFTRLVLAYGQAQLVQAMQSAGCAARHNFEQRLSRWLLITADRAHVEHFKMSQEFLSHMLGSTRPTVSTVAAMLKKEGLIAYTRGDITILDRKRLEERACECYRVIQTFLAEYESAETAHMA
jgi:CRP-like cAMP-binding protein